MDLFIDNSPETCSSLGLDCENCVRQAAVTVAKISRLDSHGVQQFFVQLFPSPGCRPMAHAFEMAYRESTNTLKTVIKFTSAAA
jgi:hypothetical protein